MKYSCICIGLALMGCTTTQYVPKIQCEQNIQYSLESQKKASEEISALPQESEVLRYMMDYSKIRDANKACINSQNTK